MSLRPMACIVAWPAFKNILMWQRMICFCCATGDLLRGTESCSFWPAAIEGRSLQELVVTSAMKSTYMKRASVHLVCLGRYGRSCCIRASKLLPSRLPALDSRYVQGLF